MDLESSVQIRPAVYQDARRIAEIHVLSWQAAYRGLMPDSVLTDLSIEDRERFWREVLLKQTRSNLVAEKAGRIIGWAAFGPARDSNLDSRSTVELYGIYLDPDIWRSGVGGEIYRAVEAAARTSGGRSCVLWVLEGNARARQFYKAMGFRETGREKVMEREGTRLPEIMYEKSLD